MANARATLSIHAPGLPRCRGFQYVIARPLWSRIELFASDRRWSEVGANGSFCVNGDLFNH